MSAKRASCLLCGTGTVDDAISIERLPLYLHAVVEERRERIPAFPFHAGACDACGHIQQTALPPSALVERMYTELYGTYQSAARTGIGGLRAGRFLSFLAEHGGTPAAALEIGCYDGHFLSLLRERGWGTVGCDPSPGAEIAARELNLDVRREFFNRSTFEAKSFELVVARQVLEHIEQPLGFLSDAHRTLRPGGILAIEVPDAELWIGHGVLGTFFHEHLSYFTADALRSAALAAGLEIVALERAHTDLFLAARAPLGDRRPESTFAADPVAVRRSRDLLSSYASRIAAAREAFTSHAAAARLDGGRVALYGAGVHSSSMVAALGLDESSIDAVLDDNPATTGAMLPNLPRPIDAAADWLARANPADLAVVSGFSFQEEMLARLKTVDGGPRSLCLYPEVAIHEPTPSDAACGAAPNQGG